MTHYFGEGVPGELLLQKSPSDAKVLAGKQKPPSKVAFRFAEITSEEGHEGGGYSSTGRRHYAVS
jgi:L-talarate/galactarate dehydratase